MNRRDRHLRLKTRTGPKFVKDISQTINIFLNVIEDDMLILKDLKA